MLVSQMSCPVSSTVNHYERENTVTTATEYLPIFLRRVMPSPAEPSAVFGQLDPEDKAAIIFFRNSCNDYLVDTV
jgi:hypothetical protein